MISPSGACLDQLRLFDSGGIDLSALRERRDELLRPSSSKAKNTIESYACDWRRFTEWCIAAEPDCSRICSIQGVAVALLQSGCQSSEGLIAELLYGVGVHRFLSGAIAPLVCGLLIRCALKGHIGWLCLGRNWAILPLGSIELENRVRADFPDPVVGAVALVFAASEFALDLKVHAPGERRGKFAELAPHDAAVPFGA
jgi:hypothetical protein